MLLAGVSLAASTVSTANSGASDAATDDQEEVQPKARSRSDTTIEVAPIAFSEGERYQFEQDLQARQERAIVYLGGGLLLTLVTSGVVMLAVGLGTHPGNAGLTTAGISSLGAATLAGFVGLELARF